MGKIRVKKLILNFLENNSDLTFPEIARMLNDKNINTQGTMWLPYKECENLYIWGSMSETFIHAVVELIQESKIHCQETTLLRYLISGEMPWLPIGRQERLYKEDHWLPMVVKKGRGIRI
jgi:hypothetical protein